MTRATIMRSASDIAISVVIPFYNEERYIDRCATSLLSQGFDKNKYEIIFVDNGSTDRSAEILGRYPVKLIHEEKSTSYAARNAGILAAGGDIIAFTDADCEASPDWLGRIQQHMSSTDAEMILGNRYFRPNGSIALRMLESYENVKTEYLLSNRLTKYYYGLTNNMAVRSGFFKRFGLFAEYPRGADTELVHRCVVECGADKVIYAPDSTVTHLEITSAVEWFKKSYLYGRCLPHMKQMSDDYEALDNKTRLAIAIYCIRKHGYNFFEILLSVCLWLTAGLCYHAGLIAGTLRQFITIRRVPRTNQNISELITRLLRKRDIAALSARTTKHLDINIHILCRHKDLESLLLSLATYYTFSSKYLEIVLHDDGTLTETDRSIMRKLFPWITVISYGDATDRLQRIGFSDRMIGLCRKYWQFIKMIDFHYIESRPRILALDTDVFLLSDTRELWERISAGDSFVFIRDPAPAYGLAKEVLEEVLSRKLEIDLKPYVNTGMVVEPSSVLRSGRDVIELYSHAYLTKLAHAYSKKSRHRLEQGYVACVLKDKQIEGIPLGNKYRIIGHTDADGIRQIKEYDFAKNIDSIAAIHLCGWNKSGRDFQAIKKKLIEAMSLHVESIIRS